MKPPKIFAGSSQLDLAREVSKKSKITIGQVDIGRFSDGEIDIWVQDQVNNSNIFIIQSLQNPISDNIIELALLTDALRRSGAHKITAVIPYFAYSRKEKQSRSGEPISAKLIADIITAAGINKIITLDLHSDAIVGFFDAPVIHLSGFPLLAKRINDEKLKNAIVVAPDVGGVKRARNFAQILNLPLLVIEKRRQTHSRDIIEILSMGGTVKENTAIIVDDIISTGSTIIENAKSLKEKGVKKIIVCATHGVFANGAIEKLEKSYVDKILTTDTINQKVRSKKIEIISTADLIASCLKKEL